MSISVIVWIVILLLLVVLAVFAYKESTGFKVTEYVIEADKSLPKDISIVMMSDLHNTDLGDDNEVVLKAIAKISPDMVLLAGDMITSYMQPMYSSEISFRFLKKLSMQYDVYYGLGNHEQRYLSQPKKFAGKYDELIKKLKEDNITLLNNKKVDLDEINLTIYGYTIPFEFFDRVCRKSLDIKDIEKKLGKPDEERFNIMLAHKPDHFKTYSKWGPDLVLSGHVHGGIVRIPGIGGVISPQMHLFPEYDWGEYSEGNSRLILSSGIGWHTIPVRLFNKAEIVHIVIRSKQ